MVQVPRDVHHKILDHAREGYPHEVCGMLAGKLGDEVEVVRSFPITNVHGNPRTEYELDPQEHLETMLHIEDELALDIVGYYHSHPTGAAELSSTDRAKATMPGAVYYLVWWPGQQKEGAGAWTWNAEEREFVPEPLTVVD